MKFGTIMKNSLIQNFSPLEKFWDEQSKRLNALDSFRSDLGNLFDDVINVKAKRRNVVTNTRLDFSVFDLEHIKLEKVATLKLDGQVYDLTLKEYAKLAVINSISDKSSLAAQPVYSMLMHVAGFLNEQQNNILDANNLEEFHICFLTQSVSDKGWATRLSPPSYRGTYGRRPLYEIRKTLYALGVEGLISPQVSTRKFEATLDRACQSVIGMTRLQYREGGSFNALTLEMGQYYVDYLKHVYENDYLYGLVCWSAIRVFKEEDEFSTRGKGGDHSVLQVLSDTILGIFVPDKARQSQFYARNKVHTRFVGYLYEQYQEHFEKVQSLKEDNICEVVRQLGLEMRFDAVEIIRVMMLQKFYGLVAPKSPDDVWKGYLLSLQRTEVQAKLVEHSTAQDVYSLMSKVVTEHRQDNVGFMSSLRQWSENLMGGKVDITYGKLKSQLGRVYSAMTSLMVAYLGYRESEFGFPLSAIQAHSNLDVLDSSHVPFRFKLKWIVPKTNKVTKIDREITSQCYQIAAQLNEVFKPGNDAPCLYEDYREGVSAKSDSTNYIGRHVKANWEHFVNNYQPFVDIRELKRLSKIASIKLSDDEQTNLSKLKSAYDLGSARVQSLLHASEETLSDLPKLLCTSHIQSSSKTPFKESLLEFQKKGDIENPEHRYAVNNFLSSETRQWLCSGEAVLDKKSMQDIMSELTQGVRYPSPHAFRHIWAEAVLLRYQGDVGAVIRHQFCHLDDSFFMAYLRNKENKGLMQAARIKVVNTLVSTLIRDAEAAGDSYLGGFARFVKKAVVLTQAITPSDIRLLKDRIEGRVISIQPSRFATCVPREGGEARAKCAHMGNINPQNARPEFCLGCTNAVITSGNIKGIWATVQPFAKDCLNEDVMGFMVQSHLPILRSAYKRINDLSPNANESVNKVLTVIQKAIANVESKLKEEEGLYA